MNRTLEDINQNEINPELYLERRRNIHRHRITSVAEGALLAALLLGFFAFVQIAYGIW